MAEYIPTRKRIALAISETIKKCKASQITFSLVQLTNNLEEEYGARPAIVEEIIMRRVDSGEVKIEGDEVIPQ